MLEFLIDIVRLVLSIIVIALSIYRLYRLSKSKYNIKLNIYIFIIICLLIIASIIGCIFCGLTYLVPLILWCFIAVIEFFTLRKNYKNMINKYKK